MRRVGVVVLCVALAGLVVPGSGAATGATLVLKPAVGPTDSTVTVKVSGFAVRERIHIAFDGSVVVSALANASGGLKRSFTVPATAAPGMHDVNATGLTSGLTADATFLVRTDWPQLGNTPDHQSDNTAENVLSVKNVSQLAVDWTQPAGRDCAVAAGGMIYLGGFGASGTGFYSVDAATGTVDWTLDNQEDFSCPAVAGGLVYVTYHPYDPSTVLEAVRANTGAPVWSQTITAANTGGVIGSPTVSGGVVYVTTQTRTTSGVSALRASDGTTLWTYTVGEANLLSPPTVADGDVYISEQNGDVVALDAASGELLWSYATGADRYPAYNPVVANGVVYVDTGSSATDRGTVFALEAQTGELVWSYPEPLPSTPVSGLAVGDGLVIAGYVKNRYAITMALDAATGTVKWAKNLGDRLQPSIANGVLYTAGSPRMRALKLSTGGTLWSYDFSDQTPVIVNGVVYANCACTSGLTAFHLP